MLLVDMAGSVASDWDPYCSYRSWSTNIWLFHIFTKYFPFWLNPRRQLSDAQIQFTFVAILYILCTSWLVWVLNTSFMDLNLVKTIFLIFAVILKGLSFVYIGYIFILKLKQLFGGIASNEMLIEIQHQRCHISWIKSFMNQNLEIKISKRIQRSLIITIFIQIIILFLWYYSFGIDTSYQHIIPESSNNTQAGNTIVEILWFCIIFFVIGIAMIIPYVIICCILYLRVEDMRYLISNQQYYNKILDLYAIICSKHIHFGSEINVISSSVPIHDELDDDDDDNYHKMMNMEIASEHDDELKQSQHDIIASHIQRHGVKIPTMDHDCRGLITFYEQIYTHFNKFCDIFKYWFLLSAGSVIIVVWCMISEIYGTCIQQFNESSCFGSISFSMLYMVYLICIIFVLLSAIKVTHNFNELEKCIEYTLNKCIVDSYKHVMHGVNGDREEPAIHKQHQEWNKEIIVLNRLSILTLKKPLYFQVFGVKLTKTRLIWFLFIFITSKTIELLYEFLK